MTRPPIELSAALREWQRRHSYTNQAAADNLGTEKRTYEGWIRGRNVGQKWERKLTSALGVASLDQFRNLFDKSTPRVMIHKDFLTQSESIFRSSFDHTSKIREVRVAFPSYPPLSEHFRKGLNGFVYEKLLTKTMTVIKIEQISNLQRSVELLSNVRRFGGLQYQVRIIPYHKWFPNAVFTIFDQTSVIAGLSHQGPPNDEWFMEYVGHEYVLYFEKQWAKMWDSGPVDFSLLDNRDDQDKLIFSFIRLIPGHEDITMNDIDTLVKNREALFGDYPPRW